MKSPRLIWMEPCSFVYITWFEFVNQCSINKLHDVRTWSSRSHDMGAHVAYQITQSKVDHSRRSDVRHSCPSKWTEGVLCLVLQYDHHNLSMFHGRLLRLGKIACHVPHLHLLAYVGFGLVKFNQHTFWVWMICEECLRPGVTKYCKSQ